MNLVRAIILLTFSALVLAGSGCKKDNINNGPFAVEPKDFLSSKKYTSLVVEVCYVDGYAPNQASLDNLKTMLSARLNKPSGIVFEYTSISSPGQGSYDIADLEKVEKDHRSEFTRRSKLAAWVFFTDAPYATSNTLGLAYSNTSFAVFEKTVKDNSGGIGQPSQTVLETTVAEHEFGHLLGLVDAGTPMTTAHEANDHHCNNSSCLMYYAVETLDFIGNLAGGEIPPFDQNCIADLQANGGK